MSVHAYQEDVVVVVALMTIEVILVGLRWGGEGEGDLEGLVDMEVEEVEVAVDLEVNPLRHA
jgi:hypothetical protein